MSIISNIYSDFVKSGMISGPETLSPELHFSGLKKIVYVMAEFLKVNCPTGISVNLSENPLEIVASCDVPVNTIYIPSLSCLDLKTVPKEFAFQGSNDPNLNFSTAQSFSNWMAHQFILKQKKISYIDLHKLRLFLSANESFEDAKKAFLFVLGHELGHIHYKHTAYLHVASKIPNILSLGIYGIAQQAQARKEEAEADAFSYQKSQELAQGALYLFSIIEQDYQVSKIEKIVSTSFKIALVFTHHSCEARAKAIKEYWKKQAQD